MHRKGQYMSQHLLNLIKDQPDPRDHAVAPQRPFGMIIKSFRSQIAYIKDQGMAGSCTAHAGTELLELLYRTKVSRLGKTLDVNTLRFAPLFLYAKERLEEGSFSVDSGCDSRTIFRVLAKYGCCLEKDDAYNAQNIFIAPTLEQMQQAQTYRIGAYHRIWDADTARSVIQSDYSFTIGIPVFQQMESDEATATGLIRLPKPNQTPLGGHEMHVIGCDDTKDVFGEIGAFEVQNSWGEQWGIKGCCWIPYSYFKAAPNFDMWTAHFGKPW